MEKLNLFSLKMKLNRHKLSYSLSNNNKSLQLGGASISISFVVLNIIIPIFTGLFLFILTILGILPWIQYITALIIGGPIAYGFLRSCSYEQEESE